VTEEKTQKELDAAATDSLIDAIDDIIPEVEPVKEDVKVASPEKTEKPSIKIPRFNVKLKDLTLSESWNRDSLRDIDKLAQALLAEGQLVPLIVYQRPDGKMEVIDGRRRYAALKEAGIAEALVNVVDCPDPQTFAKLSAAANLARSEHTPLELCRIFTNLRDLGNKPKVIAKMMSYSENTVSQYMKLEVLPDDAKKMLNTGKIDFSAARALTRLNYDDIRDMKYFDKIMAQLQNGKVTAPALTNVIDTYLARREAADSAAGKEVKKKRGRKVVSKIENYDYMDSAYLKQVKPLTSAKRYGELLMLVQERKNKARTAQGRTYEDGVAFGIRVSAGLEQLEE